MTQSNKNTMYYGDNLEILREYIADESVDLVYLDPPFNSKRTYNVLFKEESGKDSAAQLTAFDDTWHWDMAAEDAYYELVMESPNAVGKLISALREFVGTNQMLAYLVMMAIRLVELHRILKPTGSLYLHCDPTASHYLKVILDTIFGGQNYLNEIIWYYRGAGVPKDRRAKRHDVILWYAKDEGKHYFNPDPARRAYAAATVERFSHYIGNVRDGIDYGQQTLNPKGKHPDDVIVDIQPLAPSSKKRLGYPTQKPLELLEELVAAASKKGQVVLDPFCGCGTTVVAAEKLDRNWIGIDITYLAITLQKYRLQESFPDAKFSVIGEPKSVEAAQYLAQQNRFQFEWWALSLVDARPSSGTKGSKRGKKGADGGIDGVLPFVDGANKKRHQVLVQVKSGKVSVRDIRDLVGTVEREKAAMGVFITLKPPSKPMKTEAASAGFYESPSWGGRYPKIQILTIDNLLNGASVVMPLALPNFKKAERIEKNQGTQGGMEL